MITHNFDLEVNSSSGDSASFTFISDESESNYGSSSDEEIWDISDSEDDTNECSSSPVTQTISIISFFHVTYHLSERAVSTLINFCMHFSIFSL